MAKTSATLLALLATHTYALGTEPTTAASTPTAEEWLEASQPSVLSAATAVLQAVVMTPSPFRISVSAADASSSAQRFQAAQASAAALLADNTLEWLLAQPNVADTVRDLLSTDSARLEARKFKTMPRHPSAANTSWDDVAPHATNWTARAAEVQATREPLSQKNGTSSQEKTGSSSRAAVIEPAVISPNTASAISKYSAAASMRPRRLDEGSGDAPCPATTAHLQAASEHAQLDFTGGYRNNDHCQWNVQCDEAVALRFTAMDTESDYDFVSLYDGGDENAPRLAHLSGRGTSAGTSAAAAGEMLVVFTSDRTNVADGFKAEYWCVSHESVGCTDSSALNYSPLATVDDGSCYEPGICPGSTAHLQAASEHAQLDFTGGYRNNDHCQWAVQCDQTVALRFTSMDTELCCDLVWLYDGGDENAPRLALLSGDFTGARTFTAADGDMLVVFTSDKINVADGFTAEYWCVSHESVGCTDSSALNYSPLATVDDGSCQWCVEGVVDLPVDVATRKQLSFSTGLANSAACKWMIQCNETAVMQFVHVSPQSRNYISVYDGECEDAECIAHASGSSAIATPWLGHGGKMLISFDSGDGVESDGFKAEYWCVSHESVGCTDSSALNYSPLATVDDGSCQWCVEGVVDLPVDVATRKQLSFSTGLANSAACKWMIQCNETAVMQFVHVSPQSRNYISVYDGESEDAECIAHASGSSAIATPWLGHGGKMLISFDSGDGVESDGFKAEYWCVSHESVGCTDSSALNYSPLATVDDGSCWREKAALLRGFVQYPSAWSALQGWSIGAAEPCVDPLCQLDDNLGCCWDGVKCSDGRVDRVQFNGYPGLGFELGAGLRNLTRLTKLSLTNMALLVGTIPAELGQLSSLTDLFLDANPRISGTIPAELGRLSSLTYLQLYSNPRISGTIPAELGQLSSLTYLQLYSNPRLSGTIPAELGQLSSLTKLFLDANPRLSGTIPAELGQLSRLDELRLYSNPRLSGTIPAELGRLSSLRILRLFTNPRLSGTLPNELNNLKGLHSMNLYDNIALSGSLPPLDLPMLRTLNVGNCSLTGLPSSLPPKLDHLFINNNPLRSTTAKLIRLLDTVDLYELDLNYLSEHTSVALEYNGPSDGSRVYNPTQCHIGARCAFVLYLYDSDGEPLRMGGLISGLTLRFNDTATTAFVDNRDGSFTATIPVNWIQRAGSRLFRFEHQGVEFTPSMTVGNKLASGSDCLYAGDPQGCTSLRTVEFLPRQCPEGSHTAPDLATGTTCSVCEEGFEKQMGMNATQNCYKSCRIGETISHDGGSCVCSNSGYYDTTLHGIIICATGGWKPAENVVVFNQIQTARAKGRNCARCPTECTRCENETVAVLEGWRLNTSTDTMMQTQLAEAMDGRPQYVYQCPSAEHKDVTCPPMLLDATFNSTSDAHCRSHHTGPLCAICEQGYSRRNSDGSCKRCSDANVFQDHFGLSRNQFAVLVLAAALLLGALIYWQLDRIKRAKQQLGTMLKIALGLSQVLAMLKDVLNLVFPPAPRHTMSYVAMFTADLNTLYEFDCNGWDWYSKWL
eukprot:COSAG02_NODE_1037_length_15050_cov_93.060665_4_plen_1550_part_01